MKSVKKAIYKFPNFNWLLFLTCICFYGCASIPKLSEQEKELITEVINTSIPEIISGETGFATSQGHKIWFESITPKGLSKGSVILIMGNGNDALTWPTKFISNLLESEYQVIRYDHRGTGLSTSEEKWKKKKAYSLNDMAGDVIAILNALKLEKAHVVGISMGGMIAQIVAFENPERTATMTTIMSSADPMDPTLPQMSNEIVPEMVSAIFKHGFFGNKKGQIKRQIIQKRILMGNATGEIDIRAMAETSLYNLKKRNGYKLMAARHHYEAILNSNSRYVSLSQIKIPVLIIHGHEDPVIPIIHSEKLAKIIPNAETLWITNMGHDLPDNKITEITNEMVLNFERSATE